VTRPVFLVLAGPPGAGKSRLAASWRADGRLEGYLEHDPDRVMSGLPGWRRDVDADPGAAYARWSRPALELAESLLAPAMASRVPILYERTCALPSCFEHVEAARAKGYFIRLVGLEVAPETALARCRQRAETERRPLSEALVLDRVAGFSRNWPLLAARADAWELLPA
jgi:predicted ABC-type ATPase